MQTVGGLISARGELGHPLISSLSVASTLHSFEVQLAAGWIIPCPAAHVNKGAGCWWCYGRMPTVSQWHWQNMDMFTYKVTVVTSIPPRVMPENDPARSWLYFKRAQNGSSGGGEFGRHPSSSPVRITWLNRLWKIKGANSSGTSYYIQLDADIVWISEYNSQKVRFLHPRC